MKEEFIYFLYDYSWEENPSFVVMTSENEDEITDNIMRLEGNTGAAFAMRKSTFLKYAKMIEEDELDCFVNVVV